MSPALHAWFRLLRTSFAAQVRYLAATVGGLLANITFGFLRAALLFATVRAAGGSVGGYDLATMATYVWLSQGLIGVVNLSGESPIGQRVRTGDIAVDFARPLDIQTSHLAMDLGKGLFAVPTRLVPALAVGSLTTGLLAPSGLVPYLLGVVSVLFGMTISFFGRYAVNVLGFWLIEGRGVRVGYMIVVGFLSGLMVPISLFPDWLQTLAHCTPFPAILMTPIDILSGRVVGWPAVGAVAVQFFWIGVTCLIGRVLTERGRVKLEVQGG